MKIIEYHDILNEDLFKSSDVLATAWQEIKTAIQAIDWPHGSGKFTIYPQRKANGVKPIKIPCIEILKSYGWLNEKLCQLPP